MKIALSNRAGPAVLEYCRTTRPESSTATGRPQNVGQLPQKRTGQAQRCRFLARLPGSNCQRRLAALKMLDNDRRNEPGRPNGVGLPPDFQSRIVSGHWPPALAAVAVVVAAVVVRGPAVAAATAAVAEQKQQDDDPPPVVAAEPIADTTVVVTTHNTYLRNLFALSFAAHSMVFRRTKNVRRQCLLTVRD